MCEAITKIDIKFRNPITLSIIASIYISVVRGYLTTWEGFNRFEVIHILFIDSCRRDPVESYIDVHKNLISFENECVYRPSRPWPGWQPGMNTRVGHYSTP